MGLREARLGEATTPLQSTICGEAEVNSTKVSEVHGSMTLRILVREWVTLLKGTQYEG